MSLVEIPIDFDAIVDDRTVVHDSALDGDENLHAGYKVALVDDGTSVAAVITQIAADSHLHLSVQ